MDPDSMYLRLNSGGSFEVRHSATNAPVFKITDAGLEGLIGTEDLADASVTNAKLGPNSVTTDKIADGAVQNADIGDLQVSRQKLTAEGTGNRVLRTSDGTNVVWGQVQFLDIANQQVGSQHVTPGGGGFTNTVLRSTDGTNAEFGKIVSADIADGTILDADISGSAAINGGKIGPGTISGGAGGQIAAGTIASSNILDGTILDADINASANINGAKIADNSIPSIKLSGGIPPPLNTIDSSHIIDGAILNVDINASAAIAGSKLASGGVGSLQLAAHAATFLHGASFGGGSTGTPTSWVAMSTANFVFVGGDSVVILSVSDAKHTVGGAIVMMGIQVDFASIYQVNFNEPVAGYGVAASINLPLLGMSAGTHNLGMLLSANSGGTLSWGAGYWSVLECIR